MLSFSVACMSLKIPQTESSVGQQDLGNDSVLMSDLSKRRYLINK